MAIEWGLFIHGADHVEASLEASGQKAVDTVNIMTMIAADMLRIEKALFSSQGRRGGGSWKQLKPETIRKKGSARILETEGAKPGYSMIDGETSSNTLYKSLTHPDAPYSVQDVFSDTIAFGTERPQAARIAKDRPFIQFMPGDTERWANWLAGHVLAPFIKEEFGRGQVSPDFK